MSYSDRIEEMNQTIAANGAPWGAIDGESAARMVVQNRFRTGLDIARYTAKIMREDMEAYDRDPANYTQSLGTWHGFIAQQKMISIKKHFGNTKRRYLYLSGWMVAALRSEFGPLPDQSMHEKTSVPNLIGELYTFLKQADARELGMMFRDLDAARDAGDQVEAQRLQKAIDDHAPAVDSLCPPRPDKDEDPNGHRNWHRAVSLINPVYRCLIYYMVCSFGAVGDTSQACATKFAMRRAARYSTTLSLKRGRILPSARVGEPVTKRLASIRRGPQPRASSTRAPRNHL